MNNQKIEHLKMIQEVINRMSGNLFILKGWSITLIVAMFAVITKNSGSGYIIFAFCILFIFWVLDGYFLAMERRYISLYNEVRLKNDDSIDFSMDFRAYKKGRNSWAKSIFSKTLNIFYGTLLVVMIIVSLMSMIDNIKLNLGINWKNNNCQNNYQVK